MAKKQWTDEERKAFGDKMKAARQNKNPQTEDEIKPTMVEPQQKEDTVSPQDYNELAKQIEFLKSMIMAGGQNPNETGKMSFEAGKLTGTFEKYKMKGYPDPRERLSAEERLQRFAFPMNYELNFEVSQSTYTTLDNIRTREPKFTLELIRIMIDEDTGEPTDGRYVVCRLIMHEDPDAAIVIARDNGLEVRTENEQDFLDEMRYIRMRDWLLDCFYPASKTANRDKQEMVVGNRIVEFYEVNNESGTGVKKHDWDEIAKSKLRV